MLANRSVDWDRLRPGAARCREQSCTVRPLQQRVGHLFVEVLWGLEVDTDPLTEELRLFILTYAEHDEDCPSIRLNSWEEQSGACVCGLAQRLDDLLGKLDARLRG